MATATDTTRGTSRGLVWWVETYEPTTCPPYMNQYPHRLEGRIIDAGQDCGHFGWFASDAMLTDPAYVFAPGVTR